jgi:hypothetical protein
MKDLSMETLRARRRALRAGLPLEFLGDPEDIVAAAPEPPTEPAANPTAEHVAEDVAFLMANRLHMDALEFLAHRGKDGELEHNRWQRMLGLRKYEMDALTDDLHARKLAYDDDTGDRWERWTWTLTDRGRAALTAVEPEIAKEDRLRRHLGPLT